MRSIRARTSALATFFALAGAACGEPLPAPIDAAHPDDRTPRRGGELRLATFADVRALDPAVASDGLATAVLSHVFAGLVDFDEKGRVVPELAERIDVSADGLELRFPLRPGVRMHDGEELTADDVVRSVRRALHPETPNVSASFYESLAGFAEYQAGTSKDLPGVFSEGRYLVGFRLAKRDATFLPALALLSLRPTCRSAGDRYDDGWTPCGAGPFVLRAWDRGRGVVLARHDAYFRPGEPYLDRISWTFLVNPVTQRFKLEDGDIDGTRELSLADAARVRSDPRWAPLGRFEAENQIGGEGMNVEVPPFDNVEIRRAVAAAIDRDQLRKLRTTNLAAQTRVLPPALAEPEPDFPGQRHDLAAALEHMARAGYPYDPATGEGGWPHPIPYVTYKQGLHELTAQIVQQQLARIGLRLELKIVSFPTYLAMTHRRGRVAMAPQGWSQDFPDAADFFDPLFASKSINDEDSSNTSFYSNPRLDALLDEARGELDPARRRALYRQADALVCDDAPWAFAYTYRFFSVHQPYVRGYEPHAVWPEHHARTWLDRASAAVASRSGVLEGAVLAALGKRRGPR
jgi:ABC-type transport system substrate-binding protein